MNHHDADIVKTAARTMVEQGMVARGESILAGVSGGVDSVTLLWCLVKLADRLAVSRIGVAHLNHGLRGRDADNDMAFVRRLADGYGLPCHTEAVDSARFAEKNRLSLEEAGRRLRYDFFTKTAAAHGYDKIATAHHADDNAEQVLMGLIRGSGPAGLSGIPPVRAGRIIRPFINVTRADIEAAAGRERLEFITDATNTDVNFLRNLVRHELIPHLRQTFNAHITENLNHLSDMFRQEEEWLEPLVAGIFSAVLLPPEGDEIALSILLMKEQPRAVQRRLVRKALAMVKGDLRRITFVHTDEVIELMDRNQSAALDLPDGVMVTKADDRIVFRLTPGRRRGKAAAAPVFSYLLLPDGAADHSLLIFETGDRIDFTVISREDINDVTAGGEGVALFDLERLSFPLTIRNVRPGDRFVPLGMTGHQKVKDFFINRKVSRHQRRCCPVVVSGGQIIWLAGYRVADPVKITPATTRVLKAERVAPQTSGR